MTTQEKPNLQSENTNNEKWEEKKLAVLLEAASIAIKRARYVFILINMAAAIIFTAQFNSLFPWLRNVAGRNTTEAAIKSTLQEILRKELEILSIPLLGIKISVFDLTVIGSLAGVLLAVWFYYSVRREHLVVKEIVRLAKDSNDKHKRAYLYHGIAHYFVYTTAVRKDSPAGITPQTTARIAIQVLFFVPVWLPLLIIFGDIVSLIKPAEMAKVPECLSLWCVLGKSNIPTEQLEAVLRMGFAFLLCIVSFSQCRQAYIWDKATRKLVEDLQADVENRK